jgi:hypothetical protein
MSTINYTNEHTLRGVRFSHKERFFVTKLDNTTRINFEKTIESKGLSTSIIDLKFSKNEGKKESLIEILSYYGFDILN